jgi:hypothetical protein
MDSNTVNKVTEIFQRYHLRVIEDYTRTALQINACVIAQKRYIETMEVVALSTIGGIPLEYRLSLDIDRQLGREHLIDLYGTSIPRKITESYLITTIATLDAIFEDVFEVLLIERSGLNENEVNNKIQSLFRFIFDYLRQDLRLRKPAKSQFEVDAYIDTYQIWRYLRHSIVHNSGYLSDKNLRQIREIEQQIPIESRILNSSMINGREIVLDIFTIYSLRHWCLSFVSYMTFAFEETLNAEMIVPPEAP